MLRFLFEAFRPLVIPVGLMFGVHLWAFHYPDFAAPLQRALPLLPLLLLAVALLVSHMGGRSRTWFLLLSVGAAYAGLLGMPTLDLARPFAFINWVALLTPLSLIFFSLQPERPIWVQAGIYRWVWWLVCLLWVYSFDRLHWFDWMGALEAAEGALPMFSVSSVIASPLLWVMPILATLPLARYIVLGKSADIGVLVAMLCSVLALHHYGHPIAFPGYMGVAVLALMLGTIRDTYRMAFVDDLTHLAGRRVIQEWFAALPTNFTIAMVDVDHFKKINDTHGHDVGDQVLKMVASRLSEVHGGGLVARYGGEEFTILFPGKDIDEAYPHAEVVRDAIAQTPFRIRSRSRPEKRPRKKASTTEPPVSEMLEIQVSVSIGLAEPQLPGESPDEVMKRADAALYRAKSNGRNRVEM